MIDDLPRRTDPRTRAATPVHDGERADTARPVLRARELLGRNDRVVIEHDGAHYELRLTRNNKLILTK